MVCFFPGETHWPSLIAENVWFWCCFAFIASRHRSKRSISEMSTTLLPVWKTQRTLKGPRSGKWIHCTLLECVFLDNITDECSSWCCDLQWVHQMTEARGEKLWWTFSDPQAGLFARVGGLNSVRHSADPSQQTGKCLCCRANVYIWFNFHTDELKQVSITLRSTRPNFERFFLLFFFN